MQLLSHVNKLQVLLRSRMLRALHLAVQLIDVRHSSRRLLLERSLLLQRSTQLQRRLLPAVHLLSTSVVDVQQ